jgi:hypothetical protein
MAITLKPLVAGLATDAERATDFGKSGVLFGGELNEGVFLLQREMIR